MIRRTLALIWDRVATWLEEMDDQHEVEGEGQ